MPCPCCRISSRLTVLLNLPQRSGTRVASRLDVIERAENFRELGEFMTLDRPLRSEFAVTIGDEDAAAHKSASRKCILAEKRSRRASRHVRPNDNLRWKTISDLSRRLLQKYDQRNRISFAQFSRSCRDAPQKFRARRAIEIQERDHQVFLLFEIPSAHSAAIRCVNTKRRDQLPYTKHDASRESSTNAPS